MKNVGRWETNQTEENAADKITDGRGKDENISKEVEDAMRPRPSTQPSQFLKLFRCLKKHKMKSATSLLDL